MEQITQDQTAPLDETATPKTPATAPSPRRRRLIPALVGGGLAFVLAAWLTSAFLLGVGKFWAGRTEAGQLLHRAALVAASSTDLPPLDQIRDDQFIYYETYDAWGGYGYRERGGPIGWNPPEPHHRQVWISVDGSRPGLYRDDVGADLREEVRSEPPSLFNPTPRYLATLPTDPDLLLLKIYWETRGKGPNPPQEAFAVIAGLISQPVVPPDLATALYQAAARIPGIEVVPEVEDALGRPGIAIARTHAGVRREVIFHTHTFEYLGYRVIVTPEAEEPFANWTTVPEGFEPFPGGGFVLGFTAVVARAVVDEPGQLPG